jgi:hypothetical protein
VALNAGSAYSEYRLKYDGFLQDLRAVEREYARFAAAVDKGQPPTLAPDTRGAREAAQLAKLNASLAAQQARAAEAQARASATAAAGQARLTVAQNAGAISAQRLATEQQRTAAATANAASAAARAEAAQLRLAAQQERASQGVRRTADGMAILPRTFAGLSDQAASFATNLLGVSSAFTVLAAAGQTAVQGFQLKSAIDAGRASLGAFLGSQEKANAAFRDGVRFADQYAIKQSEIATALSSLAPLLRTSTTETEKQLEVLARLQTQRPGATFADAAFSVKELAGGDYASIVEQFNLSRTAAQRLRDEVAAGADVFRVLDTELNAMGASSAVLATRLEGAAGAQNRAAAATEQFSLAIGALVAGPGTALLNWYAQGTTAAAEFASRLAGQGNAATAAAAQTAASATSYDDYLQRINAANAATQAGIIQTQALIGYFGPLSGALNLVAGSALGYSQAQTALTATQYAYVQALIAAGVAEEEAVARAELHAGALNLIGLAVQQAGGELDAYAQRLAAVAAAGDGYLAGAQALLAAYGAGEIGVAQLVAGLQALEESQRRNAEGALLAADSNAQFGQSLGSATAAAYEAQQAADADAFAKLEEAAAAEQAKQRHEELEAALQRATAATGNMGPMIDFIVQKFGIEENRVRALIASYRELAAAKGAAGTPSGYGGMAPADVARSERISRNSQDIMLATGDTATQLRIVQSRLKAANAESSEYVSLKVREANLQEQIARDAARGGGGGAGGGGGKGAAKSPAVKAAEQQARQLQALDEKRVDLARDTQKRLETLERDHTERLIEIQRKYVEAQLAAENKLRVGSLRSRASFYDVLTQSTPEIGKAAADNLSAAYEAAFAEAQTLAQQGKAALASEFLSLRQSQISEELDAQKAIAAAREKGDKAEVDRLQRIEQLYKQAREEELKQLLEGGDANVNAQAEALDTESAAYAEKQAEIATASDEKALKLTANEQKILGAVQATNLAYAEQLRLQQQAAGIAGSPPLPQAQQVAQQQAATAAPPLPTTAAGGAVLVDYPALLAAMLTLGADVARLAGVTEVHSGLLDRLIAAQSETARALGRLGVRSG